MHECDSRGAWVFGGPKIIKFDGCYHGHADSLLVKAGSGALTCGNPDSAGVPPEFTAHTIVVPFNDEAAVREAFAANAGQVAGIILEPVPGNAGVYLPREGYLEFLREITTANDSLLIFDEVMTGFRVGLGGAQGCFGITPDLSCFGKIIGGGLPVGAFGGRAEVMAVLAPTAPCTKPAPSAATLSRWRPALRHWSNCNRARCTNGWRPRCAVGSGAQRGCKICGRIGGNPTHWLDGLFVFHRSTRPQSRRRDGHGSGTFQKYFHGMLAEGIYFAPSAFEAGFLSNAHTEEDVDATITAATKVMETL